MISMTQWYKHTTFKIKDIKDEVFQDYHKSSMLISTSQCDWKCCTEQNMDNSICQNSAISSNLTVEYSISDIYNRYKKNELTEAIIVGGLEPFKQFDELVCLIDYFRAQGCYDDFVIYTGYYEDEIEDEIARLKKYPNIIIKFGRFIINSESVYDPVLKINLASKNQYAKKIS